MWHLLGVGSLGTVTAARLLEAGISVHAVSRQPARHLTRTLHRAMQPPLTLTLQCWAGEPIDTLVISVKAPDTAAALLPCLPHLQRDATLVVLQNGMGTLDDIPLPGTVRCVYAVSTDGAWRDADQVTLAAENTTLMGDGSEHPPAWFSTLQPFWTGLQWCADIAHARWQKLAVNAVINPLTAVYRCPNGALLDGGEREARMAELAREVDLVCQQQFSDWPCDTLARCRAVAGQTATNTSSMLADVLAGRPTEIHYINGFLLRTAQAHGLTLPAHAAIVRQLQER